MRKGQREVVAHSHHRHQQCWPLPSYWPATGPTPPRGFSWFGFPPHLRTKGQGMASVESIPAYLQPGVSVSQPPHLEGDPSLATEILPGPPSLASIQQAGLPRKDHKKAVVSFSYLPSADPGTTYTTHFAMNPLSAAPVDMDGTRRKRARLDKGAESSRSQRASARSLAGVAPSSEPIMVSEATASSSHGLSDFDPQLLPLDSDDAMVSRATSLHGDDSPPQSVEPPSKRQRARPQKDKGKGKERERETVVKVKEEPTVVSLSEHAPASSPNEDHCSACRSLGALVYCDGCTKAFHWLCLDPPMEASDLPEGESRWFCPACLLEQRPPPKPPTTLKFMGPLIQELGTKIPTEFQVPQDIRSFFKDVGTGARGTYQDMSEVKQARFNRHGQLEDRDPYRLKDRNGEPVLCFCCGTSALPPGLAADSPTAKRTRRSTANVNNYETGRAIITCDYCHLHWHLDCIDPPMIIMPPWSKKWMCPNHAEQTSQPKRRIPRANATPIDVTKPRQWNNGNIEIVQADTTPPPVTVPNKVNVDEVLINGRRYRVPERIITLDFWDKIAKNRRGEPASETREVDDSSALSSPLTSLSSLDDQDSVPPFSMEPALYSMDDVNFAQMLCNLRLHSTSDSSAAGESHARPTVNGVQGAKRIKIEDDTAKTVLDWPQKGVASSSNAGGSTARPRRAAPARTTVASRSRSTRRSGRSGDDTILMDIDFDLPQPAPSSGKRPDARRKAARPPEPVNSASRAHAPPVNGTTTSIATEGDKNASDVTVIESASAQVPGKPKRTRQPPKTSSSRVTAIKPDPDAPQPSLNPPPASGSRKKANTSARAPKPATPAVTNGTVPVAPSGPKPEATPTLKIRLPRLGAFNSPSATKESVLEGSRVSPTKPAPPAVPARPRRSLRRQASIPTPLNSASISEAGSSTSPIESF
ncbi:hypothetical protein LXA43DRAFT_1014785 [Ganoderma leucocontextum]|nr:hypothetical protein LXA43DRAFT_1014785 [Ganoderma leucocontextum]